jgi:hypothetical protein
MLAPRKTTDRTGLAAGGPSTVLRFFGFAYEASAAQDDSYTLRQTKSRKCFSIRPVKPQISCCW